MKKKFNPFRFKAIETRYDGYLFRDVTVILCLIPLAYWRLTRLLVKPGFR